MFMLVQLISAHQVVLFCGSTKVFLFYCGQVYSRSTTFGLDDLPKRRGMYYYPIWALVDVEYQNQGPPISGMSNIWPIQATSPNPARWNAWRKQNGASVLGMPRWNTKDLIKRFIFGLFSLFVIDPAVSFERNPSLIVLRLYSSLPLQTGYRTFRDQLKEFLPPGPTSPTPNNGNINAALKVLQTKGEWRGLAAAEDCNEIDDCTRAPTTDQDETMVDEAGEPRVVAEAFEILVRNAIEKFGFAPRDVRNGVLRLPRTTLEHTNAVQSLNWAELKATVGTFPCERSLDRASHQVVAVYPLPDPSILGYDRWSINFKSNEIARQILVRMEVEEGIHLREMLDYFRKIPEGSTLAGFSFETIAHRVLSDGSRAGGPTPQLPVTHMGSDG